MALSKKIWSFCRIRNAIIEDTTVGMQQRTEILKMLYRDNEILIFDEPTAVLTAPGNPGAYADHEETWQQRARVFCSLLTSLVRSCRLQTAVPFFERENTLEQ